MAEGNAVGAHKTEPCHCEAIHCRGNPYHTCVNMAQTGLLHCVRNDRRRRGNDRNSFVIARRSIAAAIHIIHVSTWRKVDCFTAFAMTGEEGGDDRNCFVIARLFRF